MRNPGPKGSGSLGYSSVVRCCLVHHIAGAGRQNYSTVRSRSLSAVTNSGRRVTDGGRRDTNGESSSRRGQLQSATAVRSPSTALGYLSTAVTCSPKTHAPKYSPTTVSCSVIAIGYSPTAVGFSLSVTLQLLSLLLLRPPITLQRRPHSDRRLRSRKCCWANRVHTGDAPGLAARWAMVYVSSATL